MFFPGRIMDTIAATLKKAQDAAAARPITTLVVTNAITASYFLWHIVRRVTRLLTWRYPSHITVTPSARAVGAPSSISTRSWALPSFGCAPGGHPAAPFRGIP